MVKELLGNIQACSVLRQFWCGITFHDDTCFGIFWLVPFGVVVWHRVGFSLDFPQITCSLCGLALFPLI
jgi:hypothetical protein